MIIRATESEVKQYFEDPRPSQSRLKILPSGVEAYNAAQTEEEAVLYFEEKTHFIIGSAVDTILTQSEEIFNRDHFISELPKKPSESMTSIIQMIYDQQMRIYDVAVELNPEDESVKEIIIEACKFHNYQARWGDPARINAVIKDGKAYYDELRKSEGKIVLSMEEYGIIKAASNSLLNHQYTYLYFRDEPNKDKFFQLAIYFKYRDEEFKALLDILEVNNEAKTIKVVDVKTFGGYTINFPSAVRKRRYDFQVGFYSIAVSKWKNTYNGGIYKDYTILQPEFVVETTIPGKAGNPLVFQAKEDLMWLAVTGRKLYSPYVIGDDNCYMRTGIIYGIEEVVDLYKWHVENGFDRDKVVIENKGVIPISWEGF